MKRIVALILCLFLLCGCAAKPETSQTTLATTGSTSTVTAPTSAATTATDTMVTATTTTEATTMTTATTTTTTATNATVTTTTTTSTTVTTTTTAPTAKPLRVLSIGHSFSNDAHSQLAMLAAYEGREMYTYNLLYSGCSLKKHVEMWQKNEAGYWPVTNGITDWNSKVTLMDALSDGAWDIVTIQESPTTACHYDLMLPNAQKLVFLIKSKQPKAKIYIHQTWALDDGNRYHDEQTGDTMESMWPQVKANYDRLASDLNLPIIPCGLAMYNAQKAYEARGKGESVYRDGLHADEGWACYMLALIWYRTLTGEIPSSTFDMFKGPFIEDAEVRALIYNTAMEAVEAYQ